MTREAELLVLLWVGGALAVAHHYASIELFRGLLARRGLRDPALARRAVWLQRGVGVLALGCAPLLVAVAGLGLSPAQLGLAVDASPTTLLVGASGALPVAAGLALGRVPSLLSRYPEVRVADWSPALLLRNTVSWVAYIAAYEVMFRGVFLFPLAAIASPAVAVVVSTLLYSFSHTPKHVLEGTLTLIGGLYLGWCAWYTGSLLGPYVFHLLLAAGTESMAIRANPTMRFVRR